MYTIAVTIQNMYTYRRHNTKHVHLPLSIQNMYTYSCHNTKHVHIQLSQYKTCTPAAFTIQNIYAYSCHNTKFNTYRCHNTKHEHIQLSQYKTYTRTTRNAKHVGTANTKSLLSGYSSSNLPTSETTTLWKPQISQLLPC